MTDVSIERPFISEKEAQQIASESRNTNMYDWVPYTAEEKEQETESSTKQHIGQWHYIIELYTSRDLTRDSDKLPAISGLVKD